MAGYSGTPLAKKLGIRAGDTVVAVAAPERYQELLEPLPEGVSVTSEIVQECRFVHCFSVARADLEARLPALKAALTRDGMLWLSWPKKSSGVKTDLTSDVVREIGLEAGLVDVKVCAVDETWSGLKFVYRLVDR